MAGPVRNGGIVQESPCLPEDERKRPAKRSRTDDEDPSSTSSVSEAATSATDDYPKQKQEHNFHVHPLQARPLFRTMDEVHRSIDLKEPVVQLFLNSKYYQRLARVRQLGTCHLVYRGASHTRFEHSLGVAHLAKKLCEAIAERQPNLQTTKKDILCVTLAGLCHDLGHGPFSHIFEAFRIHLEKDIHYEGPPSGRGNGCFGETYLEDLKCTYRAFQADYEQSTEDVWPHERSSVFMIDAILQESGLAIDYMYERLDQPLRQIGHGVDATTLVESSTGQILTNRDWIFVKECIMGDKRGYTIREVQEYGIQYRVGREEPCREWLYDVVSNRHNGIDVDKMDYFVRDAKRTIVQDGIMDPIIDDAIVALSDCNQNNCPRCNHGERHYMICYAEKRLKAVSTFFTNRFDLHEQVYQHKTTSGSSRMIVDILRLAEPYFRIDGKPLSLSVLNAETFYKCDDEILTRIEADTNPRLKPAQDLIQRYKARDCYRIAGEIVLDVRQEQDRVLWKRANKNPQEIVQEIWEIEGRHEDDTTLELEDIVVETSYLHEGQKCQNPLKAVRFVNRVDLKSYTYESSELTAHHVNLQKHPNLLKEAYDKHCLRVYARDWKKTELVRHKFLTWDTRQAEGELHVNTRPPVENRLQGAGEDDESHAGEGQAAVLTQDDTDFEYTPPRSSLGLRGTSQMDPMRSPMRPTSLSHNNASSSPGY